MGFFFREFSVSFGSEPNKLPDLFLVGLPVRDRQPALLKLPEADSLFQKSPCQQGMYRDLFQERTKSMISGYRGFMGIGLSVVFVLLLAASFGMGPAKQQGVLSGLRPGLAVRLTESEGRYEISVMPKIPGPLTHEVIAVGENYVAVKDLTGITETVVPLYSIKCVKTFRLQP